MKTALLKKIGQHRIAQITRLPKWGYLLVVILAGCDVLSTNPKYELLLSFSNTKHVVWTLDSQLQNGSPADLSRFEPVNLIFGESEFFGDDGCNSFGAKFELNGDAVLPKDFAMTAQLCPVQSLPVEHLVESFRIRITGAELRIFALNSTYVYKSDFMSSIDNSPLLAKEWKLTASNDPEFADINSSALRPMLLFDETRTFKIVWNCDQDNLFGCNEIPGLFGVGDAKAIRLYKRGGQVSGTRGLDLVENILGSSSYDFEDNTLTLRNGATFFEFTQ